MNDIDEQAQFIKREKNDRLLVKLTDILHKHFHFDHEEEYNFLMKLFVQALVSTY